MIYLAYMVIAFSMLGLVISFWNYWFMKRNPLVSSTEKSLVSILVPVRNEEHNLADLIDSVEKQTYSNFELLIYDDDSNDNSWEIASKACDRNPKIKLIKGNLLPTGWSGKNHACHQLSLQAKGKYFLYLDADVRLQPKAVEGLIGYLNKSKSQVLTVFPSQTIVSRGEKSTVPLMMHILLSLLPLYWVRNSPFSSMAAANGQLMLFEADLYKALQAHKTFKNQKVEDILTARYIKKNKYKLSCLAGNKDISCRMYNDYKSAINGFTKFLPEFFGGSVVVAFLYGLYISLAWLFVGMVLNLWMAAAVLFLVVLTRIFSAKSANLNPWEELMFLPAQHYNFFIILIKSIYKSLTGTHTWKERVIG